MNLKFFCIAAALLVATPLKAAAPVPHPSERFGALLYQDDFREGLSQWHVEIERPGKVMAQMGVLESMFPAA